jgi:AcrR family transcriptional regulator
VNEALSGVRNWPDQPDLRARALRAVTDLAGENGVGQITLGAVLERAGTNHRAFHRHFSGVDEALAAAYEQWSAALIAGLLGAGLGAEDWQDGYRASVNHLVVWAASEPHAARLLMTEYRATAETFELHEEGAAKLARALDLGRRQISDDHQPPPLTADLAIGAMESQVAARVRNGRTAELAGLVPGLCYFGVLLYRGQEAAARELE